MTDASEGWAFLVARGRRAGYRTVLAPTFLVDENEHHVLAESTGAGELGSGGARLVELANARVGQLSVGYTSEQLARADVEAGPDGGELLTDEHGRPLEIVYGVVSRDRLERPLDAEDLRTARAHALQSYRRFLADEQGHRVDAAAAFTLRTRGRAHAAGASTSAVAREDAAAAPAGADGRHRRRRRVSRAASAIAAAIGVALVLAGSLVVSGGDSIRAVRQAWLDEPPSGPVRFCGGEDPSGSQRRAQNDYNRRFSGSRAILVRTPTTADSPQGPYRSKACDVIFLDVVYMAEFAAKNLLYDMTPYLTPDRRADFVDQIMRTVEYEGRLWGVPKQLDAGVLYYRADRVRAPSSWRDVYRQAKRRSPDDPPGLRLQRSSSEGLTVVFLELAYAAGARPIVTRDGATADVDQPQALAALRFMRDAIRDGVIPAAEPTDRGALDVYERGRASFLRGWPFVAARIRDDADKGRARRSTAANTKIVSLPPWSAGGRSVGVLGGHDLVIPRSARNPSAALHLIDYLTSDEQVRKDEREASQFPVLTDVANDPALRNRPLLKAIKATNVIARPSIPRYAEVSRIISDGVKEVLDGRADAASARDGLRAIDRDVQRVLNSGSP